MTQQARLVGTPLRRRRRVGKAGAPRVKEAELEFAYNQATLANLRVLFTRPCDDPTRDSRLTTIALLAVDSPYRTCCACDADGRCYALLC
ncbi:hypothetical protein HETIRDRAFT_442718 [Heterobasidion irregulare TC 32-1]|uniref:Uncharacterized protein n=1 Tax=Heterobasidion irregulare (strain TC 32-1) TaxID=747525 RepID=W4JPK7_HETIT|nr:uncharacterized protein HETIRDRAFT_442718 [Heterobasidion irregulare TC 32-1]ETW74796.1 hypothetical protein HETIRDRAFT_442718 [Heterobasidion irregulare TC 32-1]